MASKHYRVFYFPLGKHASFRPTLYKKTIFKVNRFTFSTNNLLWINVRYFPETQFSKSTSRRGQQEAEHEIGLLYSWISEDFHIILLKKKLKQNWRNKKMEANWVPPSCCEQFTSLNKCCRLRAIQAQGLNDKYHHEVNFCIKSTSYPRKEFPQQGIYSESILAFMRLCFIYTVHSAVHASPSVLVQTDTKRQNSSYMDVCISCVGHDPVMTDSSYASMLALGQGGQR